MTQQHPHSLPSQAPLGRRDQHYEYEPKGMIGLAQEDPWSQWAPLGAIPRKYRPPAPPAKTRWHKWPWGVGVLLVFVVIVGSSGRGSKSDATPITEQVAPNMAQSVTLTQLSVTTPPAVVEPAMSSVRNISFGDGFWIVGEDIVPGTYESDGARPDSFGLCMATAHSGKDKGSEILNAANVSPGEPIRVSLDGKQVRAVELSGCEIFTRVGY